VSEDRREIVNGGGTHVFDGDALIFHDEAAIVTVLIIVGCE
jgi:hypothetical protein